jgi:hypothetical protein
MTYPAIGIYLGHKIIYLVPDCERAAKAEKSILSNSTKLDSCLRKTGCCTRLCLLQSLFGFGTSTDFGSTQRSRYWKRWLADKALRCWKLRVSVGQSSSFLSAIQMSQVL